MQLKGRSKMKQKDIDTLPALRPQRIENMFNIYENIDGTYFYNILQTVVLPEFPEAYIDYYIVPPNMAWTVLSDKIYQTINLWWLILLVNNITNPVQMPEAGTKLKYLKKAYVGYVLNSIV